MDEVSVGTLKMNTTANRIKKLREKRGLTQAQLARQTGISEQSISKYELDQRNPKIEKLGALADFFEVPVSYLRGEEAINRLRTLRQSKGLTLDGIEKATGINRGTYSNYERGKTYPKFETWQKLSNYFEVPIPYLMGIGENATKTIYIFQSLNLGSYSFAVLANTQTQAWKLIKDRIASNKNQFIDDEFADDIRNYSISSIDLNDADPQVIEDWKR